MQEYFEVGQIVNTHGLKGHMKVVPFTDNIDRFYELKNVFIESKGNKTEYEIENVSLLGNLVRLKLKNIDTIEEAEKLKNCILKIERKYAKKLDKDSYFIADLLGMSVYNKEENEIGVLEDIFNTGSRDIYEVRLNNGKKLLLPAIKKAILKIDIEKEKIIVDESQGVNS